MTEDEAQQALAYCAVFDFTAEKHRMKLKCASGNEIVVYSLAPLNVFGNYAILINHRKKRSETQAGYYHDLDQFKIALAMLLDREVTADGS